MQQRDKQHATKRQTTTKKWKNPLLLIHKSSRDFKDIKYNYHSKLLYKDDGI